MSNNYTLWCTYHNNNIPKEYNLYETDNFKLFNKILFNLLQFYKLRFYSIYYNFTQKIQGQIAI